MLALLHLYKDPPTSKKRSMTMQTQMRIDAIKAYNPRPREDEDVNSPWVRCAVTCEYCDPDLVNTAHIVPAMFGVKLADYVFGNGVGARSFKPDNCLMICFEVERAMDTANIAFVPVDETEAPTCRWKVILTNKAAVNQGLTAKCVTSVKDRSHQPSFPLFSTWFST